MSPSLPTQNDERQTAAILELLGDSSSIHTTVDLAPLEQSETLRVSVAGEDIATLSGTVASASTDWEASHR
jgi:hypothetical protein